MRVVRNNIMYIVAQQWRRARPTGAVKANADLSAHLRPHLRRGRRAWRAGATRPGAAHTGAALDQMSVARHGESSVIIVRCRAAVAPSSVHRCALKAKADLTAHLRRGRRVWRAGATRQGAAHTSAALDQRSVAQNGESSAMISRVAMRSGTDHGPQVRSRTTLLRLRCRRRAWRAGATRRKRGNQRDSSIALCIHRCQQMYFDISLAKMTVIGRSGACLPWDVGSRACSRFTHFSSRSGSGPSTRREYRPHSSHALPRRN